MANQYTRDEQATSVSDFGDFWGYPSEIVKTLKTELGENFPQRTRVDILPNGEFVSGRKKVIWHLVGVSDSGEALISKRDAMLCESQRTGRPYFMVSKKERD